MQKQAGKQASWQPTWWNEKNDTAWERTKEALHRDWEQTKADLGGKTGRELEQDVADTVKQAAGKDIIPPRDTANAPGGTPRHDWEYHQQSIRFGVGARTQYGTQYPTWDDSLEAQLSKDWNHSDNSLAGRWDEVKVSVRRGYEKLDS